MNKTAERSAFIVLALAACTPKAAEPNLRETRDPSMPESIAHETPAAEAPALVESARLMACPPPQCVDEDAAADPVLDGLWCSCFGYASLRMSEGSYHFAESGLIREGEVSQDESTGLMRLEGFVLFRDPRRDPRGELCFVADDSDDVQMLYRSRGPDCSCFLAAAKRRSLLIEDDSVRCDERR